MPGGDGTGPMGMGSMTGRAAGYCAGYSAPGYMNPVQGRGRGFFGRGRGVGRGRGFGMGRGFGWRQAGYAYENPYLGNPYAPSYAAPTLTSQQEAQMLREDVKAMQDEVNAMNNHIKELESGAGAESGK